MSNAGQEPSKVVPQEKKSKRRTLLKGALIVLGASALIQPAGAVLGMSQEPPKKDDSARHDTVKTKQKTKKGHKKGGKKKDETPKKDGRT